MAVNKIEAFGETLIDLTGDTVTPETLAEGVTAHNAAGEQITGIAEIGGGGNVECKTLKVTADAVFTSETGGTLSMTGEKYTFEEIQNAYDEGCFIYFCIDASQMEAGTIFVMPLCVIKHNSHMSCTTILDISGMLMYIQFFITPNGSSFFIKPI